MKERQKQMLLVPLTSITASIIFFFFIIAVIIIITDSVGAPTRFRL